MRITAHLCLRLRRFAVLCALAASLVACGSTYARRDPLGEMFPTVSGRSLAGQPRSLPADFRGEPVLLFIGFEQQTQFDIDRWLLALDQAGVHITIYELPTIPGLLPGLFASKIDEGMRNGIPSEEWAIVVTIYDDADTVAQFVGNANGLPARVVLLDRTGRVAFFHDRGFSVNTLKNLTEAIGRCAPRASE